MNTKHTPGPWQAHPAEYADNGEWAISTPLRRIALVNNEAGNAHANATLIAAASALLEALEIIAGAHTTGEFAFRCASAAIAKVYRWEATK